MLRWRASANRWLEFARGCSYLPIFGKQVKPFIDPAKGDPEAARLRAAAAANDWPSVDGALGATTDRLRREFLVDSIALETTSLGWVDRWIKEQPAEQLPRLMWGACAVHYAWHIRSSKAPRHVTTDQFMGFHECLAHAEEQLRLATTMDPDDGAPWIALLWTAVGLGPPLREATTRWEEIAERSPRSELGALAYTNYVSPRWNGSAELMWKFVHGLLEGEPEGSPRWGLVADAHFEQWVAESMERDPHARSYWQQPEVQQEINEAYARYLGSAARMSSPLEPKHRGDFAVAFYLTGARDALKRELAQIGPGIQRTPWGFLGQPVGVYQEVRGSVGLR